MNRSGPNEVSAFTTEVPERAWLLKKFKVRQQLITESQSLVFGLAGLAIALVITGGLFPHFIVWSGDFIRSKPSFLASMLLVQPLFFVPLTLLGFIAAVALFCGGSIIRRFLIALAITAPGLAAFGYSHVLQVHPPLFDREVLFVLLVFFVSVGYVAVLIQLWSRWTLSHARLISAAPPRPGLRALFELTAIGAIIFAISMSADAGGVVEGIVFMLFAGPLGAIAAIGFLIFTLRERSRIVAPVCVAYVLSFLIAAAMGAGYARIEYAWTYSAENAMLIAIASVYGAAVIVGMLLMCTFWLRAWGWCCLTDKATGNRG